MPGLMFNFAIGYGSLFALAGLGLWIGTLIHQARKRRFYWLGFTAIFPVLSLIYGGIWLFNNRFR